MKRSILISNLLALSFCACFAQTVSIPDTNFRKFLKSAYPTTLDVNDQLILSKAAAVQGIFQCSAYNVSDIQGIQYFTSISKLILNNNAIGYLPDISQMKSLVWLDLSYNQLSQIPDLSNLKSLQGLFFRMNKLVQLPLLDSLKNLSALDVSFNSISQFPSLPKSGKLQTVNLNDNELKALPDNMAEFYFLKKMWLYKNRLNYKELIKLVPVLNYDSIFVVSPQKIFQTGYSVGVKEGDPLVLKTGLDDGVGGTMFRWYKNSSLIKSGIEDSLRFPHITIQDSGQYFCQIKHTAFPDLTLYTDGYSVIVNSCLDPTAFSVSVTSISCNRTGSLTIRNLNNQNVTYVLKSKFSGSAVSSAYGFFAGLAEPSYSLLLQNNPNCIKNYPVEIQIPKEECRQVLLTPNGDGEADSYFFNQTGKVSIYDKRGDLIKNLIIPGEWDGTSKSGKVAPGYYIANINEGVELLNISVVY